MSRLIEIEVRAVIREAEGINSYELRPRLGGEPLPPFTAGAHIDVHLPNGLVRSYSLSNPEGETTRYVITVANDAASRGGSRFMHEKLMPGDAFAISEPRNNFPLDEGAAHSIFIAGGIGVTPLWCMAQRLQSLGRSWQLVYCARTRRQAAFIETLVDLKEKVKMNLHFNFDGEPGGKMLDIAQLVAAAPAGTHFYCCGPLPMLAAFESATAHLAPELVHVEYFTPKEAPSTAGGFTVKLERSGVEFFVEEGKTILDMAIEAGVDVPFSCMEGTCGECETRIISGLPDHHDSCLTPREREANDKMMICCSGSHSDTLVLDL